MWKYRGKRLQLLVTPAVSHCSYLLPGRGFWGCHSKGPQTTWLKVTAIYFLTTLGARSLTPLTFWVDPPLLLLASAGGCEGQHLWSCYQHSSNLCWHMTLPSHVTLCPFLSFKSISHNGMSYSKVASPYLDDVCKHLLYFKCCLNTWD